MAFDVNTFRSQLEYDGARPNLFEVYLTMPPQVQLGGVGSQKLTFMCKSSQLPGATTGIVPVYYFGREIKVPGNKTFADWTITVINDEDFIIRNAFEQWSSLLGSHVGNLRDPSAVNFTGYSAFGSALQYGKAGNAIKQYDFEGLWPSDLAAIDLDWGNQDTIEEFTVTLAVQYWTSTKIIPTTDS